MYEIVSGLAGAVTIDDVIRVVTDRGRQSISGASCSMWFMDPGFRTAVRADRRDPLGDESTAKVTFPEGGPAWTNWRWGSSSLSPTAIRPSRRIH